MTANLLIRQSKVNSRCDGGVGRRRRRWAYSWRCDGHPSVASSLILLSFSAPSNIAFPRLHTFSVLPTAARLAVAQSPSFTNEISVGSVTPTEFKLNKIFIKKFPIQRQSSKFDSDSAKSLVAFSI